MAACNQLKSNVSSPNTEKFNIFTPVEKISKIVTEARINLDQEYDKTVEWILKFVDVAKENLDRENFALPNTAPPKRVSRRGRGRGAKSSQVESTAAEEVTDVDGACGGLDLTADGWTKFNYCSIGSSCEDTQFSNISYLPDVSRLSVFSSIGDSTRLSDVSCVPDVARLGGIDMGCMGAGSMAAGCMDFSESLCVNDIENSPRNEERGRSGAGEVFDLMTSSPECRNISVDSKVSGNRRISGDRRSFADRKVSEDRRVSEDMRQSLERCRDSLYSRNDTGLDFSTFVEEKEISYCHSNESVDADYESDSDGKSSNEYPGKIKRKFASKAGHVVKKEPAVSSNKARGGARKKTRNTARAGRSKIFDPDKAPVMNSILTNEIKCMSKHRPLPVGLMSPVVEANDDSISNVLSRSCNVETGSDISTTFSNQISDDITQTADVNMSVKVAKDNFDNVATDTQSLDIDEQCNVAETELANSSNVSGELFDNDDIWDNNIANVLSVSAREDQYDQTDRSRGPSNASDSSMSSHSVRAEASEDSMSRKLEESVSSDVSEVITCDSDDTVEDEQRNDSSVASERIVVSNENVSILHSYNKRLSESTEQNDFVAISQNSDNELDNGLDNKVEDKVNNELNNEVNNESDNELQDKLDNEVDNESGAFAVCTPVNNEKLKRRDSKSLTTRDDVPTVYKSALASFDDGSNADRKLRSSLCKSLYKHDASVNADITGEAAGTNTQGLHGRKSLRRSSRKNNRSLIEEEEEEDGYSEMNSVYFTPMPTIEDEDEELTEDLSSIQLDMLSVMCGKNASFDKNVSRTSNEIFANNSASASNSTFTGDMTLDFSMHSENMEESVAVSEVNDTSLNSKKNSMSCKSMINETNRNRTCVSAYRAENVGTFNERKSSCNSEQELVDVDHDECFKKGKKKSSLTRMSTRSTRSRLDNSLNNSVSKYTSSESVECDNSNTLESINDEKNMTEKQQIDNDTSLLDFANARASYVGKGFTNMTFEKSRHDTSSVSNQTLNESELFKIPLVLDVKRGSVLLLGCRRSRRRTSLLPAPRCVPRRASAVVGSTVLSNTKFSSFDLASFSQKNISKSDDTLHEDDEVEAESQTKSIQDTDDVQIIADDESSDDIVEDCTEENKTNDSKTSEELDNFQDFNEIELVDYLLQGQVMQDSRRFSIKGHPVLSSLRNDLQAPRRSIASWRRSDIAGGGWLGGRRSMVGVRRSEIQGHGAGRKLGGRQEAAAARFKPGFRSLSKRTSDLQLLALVIREDRLKASEEKAFSAEADTSGAVDHEDSGQVFEGGDGVGVPIVEGDVSSEGWVSDDLTDISETSDRSGLSDGECGASESVAVLSGSVDNRFNTDNNGNDNAQVKEVRISDAASLSQAYDTICISSDDDEYEYDYDNGDNENSSDDADNDNENDDDSNNDDNVESDVSPAYSDKNKVCSNNNPANQTESTAISNLLRNIYVASSENISEKEKRRSVMEIVNTSYVKLAQGSGRRQTNLVSVLEQEDVVCLSSDEDCSQAEENTEAGTIKLGQISGSGKMSSITNDGKSIQLNTSKETLNEDDLSVMHRSSVENDVTEDRLPTLDEISGSEKIAVSTSDQVEESISSRVQLNISNEEFDEDDFSSVSRSSGVNNVVEDRRGINTRSSAVAEILGVYEYKTNSSRFRESVEQFESRDLRNSNSMVSVEQLESKETSSRNSNSMVSVEQLESKETSSRNSNSMVSVEQLESKDTSSRNSNSMVSVEEQESKDKRNSRRNSNSKMSVEHLESKETRNSTRDKFIEELESQGVDLRKSIRNSKSRVSVEQLESKDINLRRSTRTSKSKMPVEQLESNDTENIRRNSKSRSSVEKPEEDACNSTRTSKTRLSVEQLESKGVDPTNSRRTSNSRMSVENVESKDVSTRTSKSKVSTWEKTENEDTGVIPNKSRKSTKSYQRESDVKFENQDSRETQELKHSSQGQITCTTKSPVHTRRSSRTSLRKSDKGLLDDKPNATELRLLSGNPNDLLDNSVSVIQDSAEAKRRSSVLNAIESENDRSAVVYNGKDLGNNSLCVLDKHDDSTIVDANASACEDNDVISDDNVIINEVISGSDGLSSARLSGSDRQGKSIAPPDRESMLAAQLSVENKGIMQPNTAECMDNAHSRRNSRITAKPLRNTDEDAAICNETGQIADSDFKQDSLNQVTVEPVKAVSRLSVTRKSTDSNTIPKDIISGSAGSVVSAKESKVSVPSSGSSASEGELFRTCINSPVSSSDSDILETDLFINDDVNNVNDVFKTLIDPGSKRCSNTGVTSNRESISTKGLIDRKRSVVNDMSADTTLDLNNTITSDKCKARKSEVETMESASNDTKISTRKSSTCVVTDNDALNGSVADVKRCSNVNKISTKKSSTCIVADNDALNDSSTNVISSENECDEILMKSTTSGNSSHSNLDDLMKNIKPAKGWFSEVPKISKQNQRPDESFGSNRENESNEIVTRSRSSRGKSDVLVTSDITGASVNNESSLLLEKSESKMVRASISRSSNIAVLSGSMISQSGSDDLHSVESNAAKRITTSNRSDQDNSIVRPLENYQTEQLQDSSQSFAANLIDSRKSSNVRSLEAGKSMSLQLKKKSEINVKDFVHENSEPFKARVSDATAKCDTYLNSSTSLTSSRNSMQPSAHTQRKSESLTQRNERADCREKMMSKDSYTSLLAEKDSEPTHVNINKSSEIGNDVEREFTNSAESEAKLDDSPESGHILNDSSEPVESDEKLEGSPESGESLHGSSESGESEVKLDDSPNSGESLHGSALPGSAVEDQENMENSVLDSTSSNLNKNSVGKSFIGSFNRSMNSSMQSGIPVRVDKSSGRKLNISNSADGTSVEPAHATNPMNTSGSARNASYSNTSVLSRSGSAGYTSHNNTSVLSSSCRDTSNNNTSALSGSGNRSVLSSASMSMSSAGVKTGEARVLTGGASRVVRKRSINNSTKSPIACRKLSHAAEKEVRKLCQSQESKRAVRREKINLRRKLTKIKKGHTSTSKKPESQSRPVKTPAVGANSSLKPPISSQSKVRTPLASPSQSTNTSVNSKPAGFSWSNKFHVATGVTSWINVPTANKPTAEELLKKKRQQMEEKQKKLNEAAEKKEQQKRLIAEQLKLRREEKQKLAESRRNVQDKKFQEKHKKQEDEKKKKEVELLKKKEQEEADRKRMLADREIERCRREEEERQAALQQYKQAEELRQRACQQQEEEQRREKEEKSKREEREREILDKQREKERQREREIEEQRKKELEKVRQNHQRIHNSASKENSVDKTQQSTRTIHTKNPTATHSATKMPPPAFTCMASYKLAQASASASSKLATASSAASLSNKMAEVLGNAATIVSASGILASANGQAAAKKSAINKAEGYSMTLEPERLVKKKKKNQDEDYGLEDLNSEHSTDDEENPRKRIPAWATDDKLKAALFEQMSCDMDEIYCMFGQIFAPDLSKMFKIKKKRFIKRTSTAHWDEPLLPAPKYMY